MMTYRGGLIVRRHTPTLAYVTDWSTESDWKNVPAHGEPFTGAQAKAIKLGYKLEHFWLQGAGMSRERLGRILYSRGIKGLILASYRGERGDDFPLPWENFSAVKIDSLPHAPALHHVTGSPGQALRVAMQQVRAAGYRRVGFIMHRGWDHVTDRNWTAGFLREQQALPSQDRIAAHLFPAARSSEAWRDESQLMAQVEFRPFARWLEHHQPEVLITKAACVQTALDRLGLRVPRDLALVDVSLDKPDGTLAGVRPNYETVGALAVTMLAGQLHRSEFGLPAAPTTTRVAGAWHDGHSCPLPRSAANPVDPSNRILAFPPRLPRASAG
jgi:LacI family transcriptional regulator